MKFVAQAVAVAAALSVSPAMAACQRGATSYDFPAQRLDEAVQQLGHRSGCPVAVDSALLADRRASALRGRFTPDQALARLIRNTGYTAHATREGLAIDADVLAITMSQARGLRTLVRDQARDGTLPPARAARLRATLDQVERTVPRQVNAQGMLTPAQKRDAVAKLEEVRAVVGSRYDARDWAAFKRRPD